LWQAAASAQDAGCLFWQSGLSSQRLRPDDCLLPALNSMHIYVLFDTSFVIGTRFALD
jgi:hypothetical protein